jgi:hypothetical protein
VKLKKSYRIVPFIEKPTPMLPPARSDDMSGRFIIIDPSVKSKSITRGRVFIEPPPE